MSPTMRLVAIVERLAERQRRDAAGLRIAIPLRRESELRRAQREDSKSSGEYLVRGARSTCRHRTAAATRSTQARPVCSPMRRRRLRSQKSPNRSSLVCACCFDAVADFATAHRRQAVQFPARFTPRLRDCAPDAAAPARPADGSRTESCRLRALQRCRAAMSTRMCRQLRADVVQQCARVALGVIVRPAARASRPDPRAFLDHLDAHDVRDIALEMTDAGDLHACRA